MDKEKLSTSELLELQGAPRGERTRFCPDDEAVAAWFDGTLNEPRREMLQRHLADCAYCRGRLGMLARLDGGAMGQEVTEDLIANAKKLAASSGRRRWKRTPAWAAAAVIALALGIWSAQLALHSQAPSPVSADNRQLRNIGMDHSAPRILSPAAESEIDANLLAIRWTPVADSLHYELFVLSDAGDLLVHERVDGTGWQPDPPLSLKPGAEYYVRVEARLRDASTASSEHSPFRVKAEQ